ncbi:MAG: ATP-binding protein [Coriobacteriales bacterium]|nr:ATP-binding protein [Coriobacteriales bacterium]
MLERKIQAQLDTWKATTGRKSLVVHGARQVGKTFAIERFGKERYQELLTINFKETPSAAGIFRGDLTVDAMVTALRFRYPHLAIAPGRTLLFLDEIQECPEAITSLKFWTLDGRYDVIASGSMLGIDYQRPSSYPVGYLDYLTLKGLDFEEFLWAQGFGADLIASIRQCFERCEPVPPAVHESLMAQFRIFCALGGMPEVIQTYEDTKDVRAADAVQRALLQGYLYDIAHYANAQEKIKAERCFLSIAGQLLAKENHKFQYKLLEKGGKAAKYYSSVDWLTRADIAMTSTTVSAAAYDLTDYEIEGNFRLYCSDLSLLLAMRDFGLKQAIVEDSLSGNTRGGLYESFIADALHKSGHVLHFQRNESTKRELDFLVQRDGRVIPVEVKSGRSATNSLSALMRGDQRIDLAYKVADANVGKGENGVITIPHYMAMYI